MSEGQLCNAKITIADSINAANTKTVYCDLYHGHEGDHGKMFYHVKKNPAGHLDNYRLGRIAWSDDITRKTPYPIIPEDKN